MVSVIWRSMIELVPVAQLCEERGLRDVLIQYV
jgi:hypothetical protein